MRCSWLTWTWTREAVPQDEVLDVPLLAEGRASTFVRWTLPLSAFLGLMASIILVFPDRYGEMFGFLAAYVIPPAGKETVIPAAVGSGFPPFLVATYVAGMDMTVAWILAWNWDSLNRLPLLGEVIRRTTESGEAWMDRHTFADRSAFLGLVVFVFFPMQGSGAIAGVTLGRLIGLPAQRTWVAIMIGALAAAFLWAYAAGAVRTAVALFGLATVVQTGVVLIASAVFVVLLLRRITP